MLRAAVVGIGHLGRYHVQKYMAHPQVELVGLVDCDPKRTSEAGADKCIRAFTDHREIIGLVDVASVVVPTQAHYRVAADLLSAGIHVLVEKPIARTIEEAEALVALAQRNGLVLQVGHLERFNPALVAARPYSGPPLFIEADRISPFPQRGTDVDVVLDLMIHDLDLILDLVGTDPETVKAVGVPVITPQVDVANARLEFPGGCVANLTASRISVKSQRKLRIFQRDAYLSIDLGQRQAMVARRLAPDETGLCRIEARELPIPNADALEMEISSFLTAVSERRPPLVGGLDGLRALALALRITADIKAHQETWAPDLG